MMQTTLTLRQSEMFITTLLGKLVRLVTIVLRRKATIEFSPAFGRDRSTQSRHVALATIK